jgi:large subunit ribosomal protein L29
MKDKQFNIKLREMSTTELEDLLQDNNSSLIKLKMNHSTAELENPIELRTVRRNVARINTELKSREIQEAKK